LICKEALNLNLSYLLPYQILSCPNLWMQIQYHHSVKKYLYFLVVP